MLLLPSLLLPSLLPPCSRYSSTSFFWEDHTLRWYRHRPAASAANAVRPSASDSQGVVEGGSLSGSGSVNVPTAYGQQVGAAVLLCCFARTSD